MALRVLQEVYDIDASDATSKSWEATADITLDIVVTVCDHARDTCPLLPSSSAIQVHWGSPDPAGRGGDAVQTEALFRQVADQIHHRVQRFLALPIEQLNRDELAAELRRIGDDSYPAYRAEDRNDV